MNSGTNLIRSAATGMNNAFIRPAASGIKMTATGMNDMLLVPVTDGIKTVAMGMNNTFVEPLAKLARISVADKDAGSEAVKTNDDDRALDLNFPRLKRRRKKNCHLRLLLSLPFSTSL